MSWHELVGSFKIRARLWPLTFVSFIIFIGYYISKRVNWLSWQSVVVLILMTWVRAPGLHAFSILFFHWHSRVALVLETTMYLPNPACHAFSFSNPRVQIGGTPWGWVNAHARVWPKSSRPRLLGQNFHDLTSILGSEPPGLHILFIFFWQF